jgi:hypothetical protein
MNERIQELAEQAKRNEPFDCGALTKDQWLEKFAELIVRECAAIALREDHEPSECILRYFGVE